MSPARLLPLLATLLLALLPCLLSGASSDFGTGWRFLREDPAGAAAPAFNDAGWAPVSLPHTARLEALVTNRTTAQQWEGVCWYRKTFTLPPGSAGRTVLLRFEGAMNIAEVFLNGVSTTRNTDGYLPFVVDLTQLASTPEAAARPITVALRLDNRHSIVTGPKPLHLLDFHLYHGLYRGASLQVLDPLHITDEALENKVASGGLLVSFPEASAASATIRTQVHLRNASADTARFSLRRTLLTLDGTPLVSAEQPALELPAGADQAFTADLQLKSPALWSPRHPNLHLLQVEVLRDGQPVDTRRVRIGIRRFALAQGGLLINGEKTFLRGVNRHQEYPYVGNALPDAAQYRDAWLIKQAGFDYVRLSHYPQSPAFMDACDELGLVVMTALLGWQFDPGTPLFHANRVQAARELVRRDRNHACVAFWELSINETRMADAFITRLHTAGHEELPNDQMFTAGWRPGYDVKVTARQHHSTREFTKADYPCIVSEYGDWEYYAGNAGLNQEQWGNLKAELRNSRQLRGHGEQRLLQQATNLQEAHNENRGTRALADGYWVMFDYNRGYADDLEASGLRDIFRLPKFSEAFFRSQRDPAEHHASGIGGPMVHIATYWTPRSPLEVRVFSNCDEVELLLNDVPVARQKPDTTNNSDKLAHPPFTFRVPSFTPGTLKARAWLAGKPVAEHSVSTPGAPQELQLLLALNGRPVSGEGDLLFLHARIVDRNGTLVPDASPMVHFEANEALELIGNNPARAEAGIASILVRVKKPSLTPTLRATTPGLPEGKLLRPGSAPLHP